MVVEHVCCFAGSSLNFAMLVKVCLSLSLFFTYPGLPFLLCSSDILHLSGILRHGCWSSFVSPPPLVMLFPVFKLLEFRLLSTTGNRQLQEVWLTSWMFYGLGTEMCVCSFFPETCEHIPFKLSDVCHFVRWYRRGSLGRRLAPASAACANAELECFVNGGD